MTIRPVTIRRLPLPLGLLLTGALAAPLQAAPQARQDTPLRPANAATEHAAPTRLTLRLEPQSTWSFEVQRGDPNPLDADAAGEPDPFVTLGYRLSAERSAEDDHVLLAVEIRVGRARSTPDAGPLAVYLATVDGSGEVLRLAQREDGEGRRPIAPEPARVRLDLERILGTGLHAAALEPGESYALGDQAEAQAPTREPSTSPARATWSDALTGARLRFEGVRAAAVGRVARFTILPRVPAGAAAIEAEQGPPAEGARGKRGRAVYALADGLLEEFRYRPEPDVAEASRPAGRAARAWITIRRLRQE